MAERERVREGIAQTEQADEDRPVPVPFMSLLITSPKYDASRFNPSRFVISKDIQKGTAQVARYMRPVVSDVQVDLWCGSAGGDLMAMSIEPQVELAFFADHRALHLDWGDPRWYKPPFNISEHASWLGKTSVVLYTQGWEDTSDLESGDGPKEMRRTWRGRLDAYVPFRPEEARIVRTVPLQIIEPDTAEVLGLIAGGFED
jgi:hypothetical protein